MKQGVCWWWDSWFHEVGPAVLCVSGCHTYWCQTPSRPGEPGLHNLQRLTILLLLPGPVPQYHPGPPSSSYLLLLLIIYSWVVHWLVLGCDVAASVEGVCVLRCCSHEEASTFLLFHLLNLWRDLTYRNIWWMYHPRKEYLLMQNSTLSCLFLMQDAFFRSSSPASSQRNTSVWWACHKGLHRTTHLMAKLCFTLVLSTLSVW